MDGPALPAWQRILSDFLTAKGVVTVQKLSQLHGYYAKLDRRIGQLSLLKGYLGLKDVLAILGVQTEQDLKFGEAAVRAGKMSEAQVKEILSLQKDPSSLFLQSLVFTDVIDESKLPALLEELRKHLASRNQAAEARPAPPAGSPAEKVGRDDVRGVLKRIKSLGTLPVVVQKVLAMTDDPECEVRKLAQTVTADPSLTAQLLRVVNSAAFGASRRITNAVDAISRIGVKGLRNVALASALLDRFKGADQEGMRRIWLHSVHTSQWAQALARSRGLKASAEDAFIAGLVHDVGRTVLRQFFPELTPEIDRQANAGRPLVEVERECFGLSHEDAGAYLCELWSFPLPVTQAVGFHHASIPTFASLPSVDPVASCVHAACRIADLVFDPDQEDRNRQLLASLDPEFQSHHRLPADLAVQVPQILARARELASWLS
jgi:putative nucleotidyltransferase with HDIG domain